MGEPLKTYCRNPPVLTPKRTAQILVQILSAISECHQRGIVHLDLTPSNVLLSDNRAVLIDFGLAGSTTGFQAPKLGSLSYMAPELMCPEHVYAPVVCDIFSMGVVFYELLTGLRPYSKTALKSKQLARPIRDQRNEIDFELERICMKAIALEPIDRFQTATEFSNAIDHWLDSQSVTPRFHDESTIETLRTVLPWSEGARRLAVVSFLLAFVGVLLVALSTIASNRRADMSAMSEDSLPKWMVQLFRERLPDHSVHLVGNIYDRGVIAHEGDLVTIHVSIPEPSYCYLAAANPDGSVQFLKSSEQKVRELNFPDKPDQFFQFSDGAGQQVFVLVVSDSIITQWDQWTDAPPSDIRWNGADPLLGVWEINNRRIAQVRPPEVDRGDVQTKFLQNEVFKLKNWFQKSAGGETHCLLVPVLK